MRRFILILTLISILHISFSNSCLTFENVENKLLINNEITIYIRNCGTNYASAKILLTYLNNYERKEILLLAPNEIKAITFKVILPLGITKTLATVYAYNSETFIQSSFYVLRPEHFVDIEVPKIEIEKGRIKEFFIKIKNIGSYEIENELEIVLPKNFVGYFEEERIKILPRTEKYVKLTILGKEIGKYEGVVRFGNFEKKFEIYVKEEFVFPKISDVLPLVLALLFLVFLFFVIKIVKIKKDDCNSLLYV
jgi:hypothetical protein